MRDYLYKKYKDFFDKNQELLEVVDKQLIFISGKKAEDDLRSIAIFLWCRATVTMQAIQSLCRDGFGEDALALVRCLFEMLVSLRYIKKDPQKRTEKFIRFSIVQEKEYLERFKQAGIGEIPESNSEEIAEAYEKVKNTFGPKDKDWTDFDTSLKRNHKIKEISEEAGLVWDYNFVYYSLSHLFIHSSPRGVTKYVMETLDGGALPILRPGDRQIKESLALSQRYFSGILKDFNEIWEINIEIKSEFLC